MASTYSTNLKIELIGTGEQAGTWGTTTNTNLGTALEQAVVGKADVTMSSTTITLTLTNANTAQDARAIYLNLTGSPGGAAVLEVPAIQKPYIVKNGSDQQVTIKVSGLTGVPIPTGKTALVYNNGTDVVTAVDHIPSLTLGAALPVASGGTGITSFGTGVATFLGTPSSANLAAAVTDETGSGALVFATSPTLITPALGTPSSGTLTNATGLPLSTGVTGLLPVANGGTATATPSLVAGSNVTVSGTWPNQTIASSNSGGTVTSVSGTGTVQGLSLSGTVTSSGNLTLGGSLSAVNLTSQVTGTLPVANGGTGTTSTTFANLTTNVTGTLPVANGGTGATTLTSNNVIIGNGTSAVQFVAPSTTGNVLTSNGTTWTSAAASGGVTLLSTVTGTAVSTLLVNSGFTSTYDTYDLVIYGTASNNNAAIRLRYELGGSVISTSTYQFKRFDNSAAGDSAGSGAPSTSASVLNVGNSVQSSGESFTVTFRITNPASATLKKLITWTGASVRLEVTMNEGVVLNQGTTALTGIQIFPDGGTITATARLYGYTK
jgi:hypothetical protein